MRVRVRVSESESESESESGGESESESGSEGRVRNHKPCDETVKPLPAIANYKRKKALHPERP